MKVWMDINGIIEVLGKKMVIDLIQEGLFEKFILDLTSDGDSIKGMQLRKYVKVEKQKKKIRTLQIPWAYGC